MPIALSTACVLPKVKHSAESILFGVDFRKLLETGETLSAVTIDNVSGITITNKAVNTEVFDDDDAGEVPIGKGVRFRVAGGTAGTDYTITVVVTTSAGNTRVAVCTLQVRDS